MYKKCIPSKLCSNEKKIYQDKKEWFQFYSLSDYTLRTMATKVTCEILLLLLTGRLLGSAGLWISLPNSVNGCT